MARPRLAIGDEVDLLIRLSSIQRKSVAHRQAVERPDLANPNFSDQDFVNIGAGLALQTGEISITVDVIRTISGRNTAKGTYLGGGVSHSW